MTRLTSSRLGLVLVALMALCGCAQRGQIALPNHDEFVTEQLIFRSDFKLPRRHRLIEELLLRRRDISDTLFLPMSDEPINVYIFEDEARFRRFMRANYPQLPYRRAFFVKNDTTLNIYVHWGEKIAEDLRHEVTHSYLHAVVTDLPLWMDEGLAEFFETPRISDGFNRQHIYLLLEAMKDDDWQPDLKRLEALDNPMKMSQMHYAESWLWVHFLLKSEIANQEILQNQLARIRMNGVTDPLSKTIEKKIPEAHKELLEHLQSLVDQL
ncbi:MAG TPA: DUF1570 domain-containing protein [Pirellulaceae bacterium]|nr:DUF1570 domain-containing protein [Pirellulaceae bacterium]